MKIKYFKNMDSMEIMYELHTPNIGIETEFQNITKFVHRKNNRIIGYYIEGFSKSIKIILSQLEFTLLEKLAIMIVYQRALRGLTREQVASDAGIGLSSYRRMEEANNFSIDMLEKVMDTFKNADFSICFSTKIAS